MHISFHILYNYIEETHFKAFFFNSVISEAMVELPLLCLHFAAFDCVSALRLFNFHDSCSSSAMMQWPPRNKFMVPSSSAHQEPH
jgi:hypothetical protein